VGTFYFSFEFGRTGVSPAGGGTGWSKSKSMKADKSNYHLYNTNLQPFANALRKNMTKAEACLWKYVLRARKMKGYPFRRQRPVLHYIADFMCKDLNLVIEVDGLTHEWEQTQAKDSRKERDLKNAGFFQYCDLRMMRF